MWVVAAGLAIVASSAGHADWNEFWERVGVDFHRNNCYPEPFVHADREAVRAPFIAMINNGWRRQNTLGDQHFDGETQKLNGAGLLRLREILTENPEQFRTVFVQRTAYQETTGVRIQSVQATAGQLAPQFGSLVVYQTGTPPVLSPADYTDDIMRKVQSSIPAPRLAPQVGTGGGSGM
jgi:hypothetical protein